MNFTTIWNLCKGMKTRETQIFADTKYENF